MTRDKFLKELKYRIGYLPNEEQDAAMAYYIEYFEEAGNDEAVLQELGSPAEVAARIISDYNARNNSMPVQQVQPKAHRNLAGILAGILSAPLWIPLLFVVGILALVLLFVLVLLFFIFFVVALALMKAAIHALAVSISTAIFGMGASILLFGLLILAAYGIICGSKALFHHFIQRKGA